MTARELPRLTNLRAKRMTRPAAVATASAKAELAARRGGDGAVIGIGVVETAVKTLEKRAA
jgi:hypothetical protein